jgi:hypothetical protein
MLIIALLSQDSAICAIDANHCPASYHDKYVSEAIAFPALNADTITYLQNNNRRNDFSRSLPALPQQDSHRC